MTPTPRGHAADIVRNRTTVAHYSTYDEAQAAVDHLSDTGFPVNKVSLVGSDLRMVENVLGRLTRGRAALAGAGSGAWLGLFVGLLLSIFAPEGTSTVAVLLDALLFGVLFGATLGFVAHTMTRGRRDFTSRGAIVAARYDVHADPDVAEDAANRLIKLGWRG